MDFGGFILVHRRLCQNPVWTQLSPAVLKVMMACLIKANWKAAKWYDGAAEIEIPRGSFITSYPKMAEFCHLTVKQVRGSLDHLERAGITAYTRAPKWTMVTVLNYSTYQDMQATVGQGVGQGVGRLEGRVQGTNRTNNKGTSNTCASDDAPVGGLASIDEPPFETTEPGALFPIEPSKKNPRDRDAMTADQEQWFSVWWAEYWLHKSKKDARIAFRKHVRTEGRFQQVLTATRQQRPAMLAREDSKRPYPATWLNGARWEDEISSPQPAQTSGAVYRKLEIPA